MMLRSKVRVLLLLLLLCVQESLCSSSVSPSVHRPSLTRVRIIEVEDDYDEESSRPTPSPQASGVTTSRVIRRPCDYDPCVAQTTPCDVVSAKTGCLCPGLTGPEERPEPPELRNIKPDGSGEALVHWCAPRSSVKFYEVTINDGNTKLTFREDLRKGTIPGLKIGETVCVAAGNEAGLSERACTRYEPPPAGQAALSAGIIAGVTGFLLLLVVLAVVLWKRRTCQKAEAGDAEGLGNPSYASEH